MNLACWAPATDTLKPFRVKLSYVLVKLILLKKGKFSIMEEYLDLMHTEKIHGVEHKANLVDVGRPESVLESEKIFK